MFIPLLINIIQPSWLFPRDAALNYNTPTFMLHYLLYHFIVICPVMKTRLDTDNTEQPGMTTKKC
jgi:hypothetical protein